jgi:aminomethyltransferase
LRGERCFLARTGYTGEKGYELYLPHGLAPWAWEALLATNPKTGIQPIGLGARDTLRLEAGYLLYGNDLNETISPLQAGIAWATKLDGEDFVGRAALLAERERGSARRLVCFKMEDQGIARHDMEVYLGETLIGTVTSGSVLPTVGGAGGMALVTAGMVKVGDRVGIKIRHEVKQAVIVNRPLYVARVKD